MELSVLEKQRRSLNTAQECLRLGKENFTGGFSNNDAFVFFKNGTCVLVYCKDLKDEQAVIDTAKEELQSAKDIYIDFIFDDNDLKDSGKGYLCLASNFLLRTVWNACWYSCDIDEIIIKELRCADKQIISETSTTYIGASAGACLCSENLFYVTAFEEDRYGLDDYTGLGIIPENIVCHCDSKYISDIARARYLSSDKQLIYIRDDEIFVINNL